MSDGEVYVYYTATVNADAVVGVEGNPNKVKLTFQAGQSHEDVYKRQDPKRAKNLKR